ncbi:MAG TPA: hypothetical protein VMW52_13140 [Phycisphaerae bacterium]|nr:hypothetical protein [Phycisphaerae bacterium]
MASIGGTSVISIHGGVDVAFGEEVEVITRPGADGLGVKTTGKRSPPSVLYSESDHATAAAAETVVGTFKAMQGTLVTIVDDHGTTCTNVLVIRCAMRGKRYVATPVGGVTGGNVLLAMEWIVQTTESS